MNIDSVMYTKIKLINFKYLLKRNFVWDERRKDFYLQNCVIFADKYLH